VTYSKKSLNDLKAKLKEKNPSFFDDKNKQKKIVKVKIKTKNEKRKKIIKWNYQVNDLVKSTSSNDIGLIVSDNEYFGAKVEKNYYFVLFGCSVIRHDGQHLRKI
jgi:ribosomal 30S subunit maturation factor RimM